MTKAINWDSRVVHQNKSGVRMSRTWKPPWIKASIDFLMTRESANMRMPTTFSMMTKRGCCSRHLSKGFSGTVFLESL